MTMFENLSKKPLTERVADSLTRYVLENDLQEGDRIPNEFELAEKLGVGRSTVREAVKILVSRNLLVIKRGSGTFVADKQAIINDPLGVSKTEDKLSLAMDLCEVRLMLEPEIASMAAIYATDEEIENIEQLCNNVEQLYTSGKNHMAADIKLHEYIAHCSGNIVIEKIIPIINSTIAVFANVTQYALKQETIETHRNICNAIKNHDAATAKYAMTMHLLYNRNKIMELMKEENQLK